MSNQQSPPHNYLSGLAVLTFGTVLYYTMAKLGMILFSLTPSNITLLWLPSGIGLVMCYQVGIRAVPFILLSSAAANYPGLVSDNMFAQLAHSLISGLADSLAAFAAANMMQRYLAQGLNTLYQLFQFGIFVCLLPTLLSALILATNLAIGGYIPWHETAAFILMLTIADSLGILVVFPLFEAWKERSAMSRQEWLRWVILSTVALAMVYLAFSYMAGLIFLVIPFLLYLAFHGRAHVAYLTLGLVVLLTVALAAQNLGPFRLNDENQARFMLIAYLFSITFIMLGMVLQCRELIDEKQISKSWRLRAQHDPLTGLDNRERFMPMLAYEFERASRLKQCFSVAMIDLDFFKSINDNFGHATGDKVLIHFAKYLQLELRQIDISARIGGEEFAVLFPGTSENEAYQAMERLRQTIQDTPAIFGNQRIALTISAGVAEYHADDSHFQSAETLLKQADECLYRAKHDGRNCVAVMRVKA